MYIYNYIYIISLYLCILFSIYFCTIIDNYILLCMFFSWHLHEVINRFTVNILPLSIIKSSAHQPRNSQVLLKSGGQTPAPLEAWGVIISCMEWKSGTSWMIFGWFLDIFWDDVWVLCWLKSNPTNISIIKHHDVLAHVWWFLPTQQKDLGCWTVSPRSWLV